MEKIVVFVTTATEEDAASIAGALVTEGLAACANIVKGVRSIYRWKGAVFDDSECLMVIKTVADNFASIEKLVRELHPYEVPEIIALPITRGYKPYMDWVEENSRLG